MVLYMKSATKSIALWRNVACLIGESSQNKVSIMFLLLLPVLNNNMLREDRSIYTN